MGRLLVIPAAGLGSRLGSHVPKILVPVAGRPMLDHLLDLYAAFVEGVAVIVHPAALDQVRQHVIASARPTEIFLQDQPTGMLDAILLARPAVEHVRAERVWITWCDQVAIHP